MKLLCPTGNENRIAGARNDSIADAETSHTWWPWFGMAGAAYTSSGLRVNEDIAMTFSAVFCATRIISETLAALPMNLMRQVDVRHSRRATEHPQWYLLHDEPNPEQDSMTWFDMMTAFQVNWGNAYAEKQYDLAGNVIAYWPIHPSRIPPRNVTRNPKSADLQHPIKVGDPGGIVYWVNNDDGTKTPIPARDMLHVPGVLSQNGITGQGIVRWGANSIGVGLATDRHAAAFFRNGAVTNIIIKSPKIVGEQTANRLRSQWQQVFGGVDNHYKTLLLEDGMEAAPVNLSAEDSQLIQSRQFGIAEIARWYRLPPHMLADLSRSSFANIEAENLSFVIHSMMPWIVRWERALKRQILTPEEKACYFFRFNVNGLMRGDSVARAAFYKTMFSVGAFSPNDIRSYEDLNPVEGGDEYFVPTNNLTPLSQVANLLEQDDDDSTNGRRVSRIDPDEGDPNPDKEDGDEGAGTEENRGSRMDDRRSRRAGDRRMAQLRDLMQRMVLAAEQDPNVAEKLDHLGDRLRDMSLNFDPSLDKDRKRLEIVNESVRIEIDALRGDLMSVISERHSETVRAVRETIRAQEQIAADDLSDRANLVTAQELALEQQAAALETALHASLTATVSGMMVLERQKLLRAADKPGTFLAARDEFYSEFSAKLIEALGRFGSAMQAGGRPFDVAALAAAYCGDSILQLDPIVDLPCDEFKVALGDLFQRWEIDNRAGKFVDALFQMQKAE